VQDTYTENHITTIGVDYKTKIVEDKKNNEMIKLQIWDTAGQDKFRCITKNYFRGSNGILLIYDITNQNSFKNIRNWVSQIKESLGDEACIALVGNKVDLEKERKVANGIGQNLANEFKMNFFETSAKNNFNIEGAFEALVKEMTDKYRIKAEFNEEKGRSYSQKLRNESMSSRKSDQDGKKKKWC
jgi:Ras-related protein Rab-1A